MNTQSFLEPANLEKYSFWWTEARLIIAAVALFIGGTPPFYVILSNIGLGSLPLVGVLLTLSWIITGVVSVYLAYRWWVGGQVLFGGKSTIDLAAFGVAVVSGLNLGVVGLIGQNIGMSITTNYAVFIVVGFIYLAAAYQLYRQWQSHGQKMF